MDHADQWEQFLGLIALEMAYEVPSNGVRSIGFTKRFPSIEELLDLRGHLEEVLCATFSEIDVT